MGNDLEGRGHAFIKVLAIILISIKGLKKTPWSESASELYRPSDRRLQRSDYKLLRIEVATWSA
jgi:hypothetical protein